jgi:hypothetical protein
MERHKLFGLYRYRTRSWRDISQVLNKLALVKKVAYSIPSRMNTLPYPRVQVSFFFMRTLILLSILIYFMVPL